MHKWLIICISLFYSCTFCGIDSDDYTRYGLRNDQAFIRYKTQHDSDFYTYVNYVNLGKSLTIPTSWTGSEYIIPHAIILPYKNEPQTMVFNSIRRTDTVVITTKYEAISDCDAVKFKRSWVTIYSTTNPAFKWNGLYFIIEN